MKKLMTTVVTCAAATLASAGGADAQAGPPDITLLHGVPGLVADVIVDGSVVVSDLEPGQTRDLSDLAGDTLLDLEMRASDTGEVVFGPVPTFDVPDTGAWTIVLHLDRDARPAVTPFEDRTTPTPPGESRLTFRHVADVSSVDLVIGDRRPVVDVDAGSSTELMLPSGPLTNARLALTGQEPTYDLPVLDLADGEDTMVYGVGSLDAGTFTVFVERRTVGIEPADRGGDDDAAGAGDGTPQPGRVDTGTPLDAVHSDDQVLAVAALGLFALAGVAGALALRRPDRT